MSNSARTAGGNTSHFPTVNLDQIDLDPELTQIIPYHIAKRHMVLPLFRQDRELTLAMKDPTQLSLLNDIEFLTGLQIIPVLASCWRRRKPPAVRRAAARSSAACSRASR